MEEDLVKYFLHAGAKAVSSLKRDTLRDLTTLGEEFFSSANLSSSGGRRRTSSLMVTVAMVGLQPRQL